MLKHIKKIVGFLLVLLVSYQIVGCGSSSTSVQDNNETLSVAEKLNKSQLIWNSEYGTDTQIIDWKLIGEIKTKEDKANLVNKIMSPEYS